MTAPAGGVEQVVEGSAILTGNHVLNWAGTATATVGGTARTKGEVFTLTGGSNATVRFSGGTFSLPQLEAGSSATVFSTRHPQQELALCQRYYYAATARYILFDNNAVSGGKIYNSFHRPVSMRITPTLTLGTIVYSNASALLVGDAATPDFIELYCSVTSAGSSFAHATPTFDAEI